MYIEVAFVHLCLLATCCSLNYLSLIVSIGSDMTAWDGTATVSCCVHLTQHLIPFKLTLRAN
uniref:Uncharacterized protein n=2 Tax=Anguilla anguilla TaxID=7936 RepID=A0A0E9S1L2_ANGAN